MSDTNVEDLKLTIKRNLLVRRAIGLAWFTIAYNLVEGVVSVAFGLSDDSVSLAGFGIDSFIEAASALIVIWRFRGESRLGDLPPIERERRATLGIGALFLALAFVTAIASSVQLWKHAHPETTLPGVIVSALSLSFMFFLWTAKKRVGYELGSQTVLKDAACSLACIKLCVTLLIGSAIFAIAPALWWTDAVAGLILAVLIGLEGREMIEAARSEDFAGGCGCAH